MEEKKTNLVSLMTGLTLIFTVAKLWGVAELSWWQVFMPKFIEYTGAFITLFVLELLKNYKKNKIERGGLLTLKPSDN